MNYEELSHELETLPYFFDEDQVEIKDNNFYHKLRFKSKYRFKEDKDLEMITPFDDNLVKKFSSFNYQKKAINDVPSLIFKLYFLPDINFIFRIISKPSISISLEDVDSSWLLEENIEILKKLIFAFISTLEGNSILWQICMYIQNKLLYDAMLIEENSFCKMINLFKIAKGREIEMAKIVFDAIILKSREEYLVSFIECDVCYNLVLGLNVLNLSKCCHYFCKKCVISYVDNIIKSRRIPGGVLTCLECAEEISLTDLKDVLDNHRLNELDKLLLEQYLRKTGIYYCPRRCQSPAKVGEDSLAICVECEFTFCFLCQEPYHSGYPCYLNHYNITDGNFADGNKIADDSEIIDDNENIEKLTEEFADDSEIIDDNENIEKLTEEFANEVKFYKQFRKINRKNETQSHKYVNFLQRCPKCRVPIEKNGGCNHMYCTNCYSNFNWN